MTEPAKKQSKNKLLSLRKLEKLNDIVKGNSERFVMSQGLFGVRQQTFQVH